MATRVDPRSLVLFTVPKSGGEINNNLVTQSPCLCRFMKPETPVCTVLYNSCMYTHSQEELDLHNQLASICDCLKSKSCPRIQQPAHSAFWTNHAA